MTETALIVKEQMGKVGTCLFIWTLLGVFSAAAGLHFHRATFTSTTGFEKFSDPLTATFIDEVQVTRYDSHSKTLNSSCGWVRKAMNEAWKSYEDFCKSTYYIRQDDFIKFGKKEDVQTFQWISHCIYDDQKGVCEGYEKYGYNGEDFISLEVKQMRYVPHTPDAAHIADIWNKQSTQIGLIRHYFNKEFPDYLRRAAPYLQTTVIPDVHLWQKNSSSPVVCLATGFNSSAVTMIWRKNGQALHEDVDEGEPLPNGDGTFQKRISLKVETEEWKENQYHCVVQHKNWKQMIIKSVTEAEIKHNPIPHPDKSRVYGPVIITITVIIIIMFFSVLFLLKKCKKGATSISKHGEVLFDLEKGENSKLQDDPEEP
ncbi:hypothetical protein AOLI_G00271760 [Acnodon oligacanthus]